MVLAEALPDGAAFAANQSKKKMRRRQVSARRACAVMIVTTGLRKWEGVGMVRFWMEERIATFGRRLHGIGKSVP